MNDIPTLSKMEALILSMLIAEASEMYGWDMVEKSNGALKLGGLYTTLNRMEDKGYIESRKESVREGARGRPRRMYKTTGHGMKVYAFWEVAQQTWAEKYA